MTHLALRCVCFCRPAATAMLPPLPMLPTTFDAGICRVRLRRYSQAKQRTGDSAQFRTEGSPGDVVGARCITYVHQCLLCCCGSNIIHTPSVGIDVSALKERMARGQNASSVQSGIMGRVQVMCGPNH